ncbi:MAG: chlorohydrolase family protein [Chloroflexota bacterium]|nr:chlorohydrolase family protein [Chloroflexota bacterium]
MKTKIKAQYVIGYQGNDHVIFENGELVYEDDRVIYVGHHYPGDVDQSMDAGKALVSPGFIDINALADIDTTIMTYDQPSSLGLGNRWSDKYFNQGPKEVFSPEEETFKSRYALTQLIYNGITTAFPVTSLSYRAWGETKPEFEAIVDVAKDLGLRVYLGPSYRSAVNLVEQNGTLTQYWDEERGMNGLHDAVEFIEEFDGQNQGLIKGLLVPSTIETCSNKLLTQTKKSADEYEVPIRLHAAQSARDFNLTKERFGMTPIKYLNSIGFLGPRTIIPHATYVDGYSQAEPSKRLDVEILRDTETIVVHCPFVLARSGSALDSFEKYKNLGIRIVMGTDCYPSDMLMNLRLGSVMCRMVEHTKDVASTADLFRAATIWPADSLGRPDLGRLAAGSKADFFIFDLSEMHIAQIDGPIRTMILNGQNTDFKTVVINGKIVMQDRQIPGVDVDQFSTQSQTLFDKLKESYSQRDYRNRPQNELFPENFMIKKDHR